MQFVLESLGILNVGDVANSLTGKKLLYPNHGKLPMNIEKIQNLFGSDDEQ
jgi:hypothetical protein